MFRWIKTLKHIVSNYRLEIAELKYQMLTLQQSQRQIEGMVKPNTTIAVDCDIHGINHIIVVGNYKNQDYIQTFNVSKNEFAHIIAVLTDMKKYGSVRCVDAMPEMKRTIFKETMRF